MVQGILQGQLGFANAPHAAQGGNGDAIRLMELGVQGGQILFAAHKLDRATAGQVMGHGHQGASRRNQLSQPLDQAIHIGLKFEGRAERQVLAVGQGF